MCGRYASSRGAEHLVDHFEVDEPPEETLPPSWNVAPTDPTWVVAVRSGTRRLAVARWGLVPSWAQPGRTVGRGRGPLINARRETAATAPAFRSAFARRRCLVPADGYYEWQQQGAHKQPWFLSARDGGPLAMAGLYEVRKESEEPAAPLQWSCTVLTTSAPDELGEIHDRTPLLVPREHWRRWLDPEVEHPGEDLLVPGTPGVLDAWPVGPAVGNVRNDGPELVAPVEAAPTLLE
ncbi:MAG TPA: SOS response-associated peptidase [Mycobacteriales bacterium]|nr:SOS response-associated peptidase [Mycobacteriales bacterium]